MTVKPALYRLIDKDGNPVCAIKGQPMAFASAQRAAQFARDMWPDQEQDEPRTGKGWDIEVIPTTD